MPLCFPECGNVMKSQLDKPNYRIHKKCHDCVIEFEHKLKIRGEYDSYIRDLQNKNSIDILNETEELLLDLVNNTSNSSFVSENGVVEKWKGGINKEKLIDKVKTEFNLERKKLNEQGKTKRINS